jgi:hypothetical protein
MQKVWVIAAIVLAALLLVWFKGASFASDVGGSGANGRSVVDKGNIIIYGSRGCPWCQKQEQYMKAKGIPYTFTDCDTESCPGFVNGYPTILQNGEVLSGYTEL